MTDFILKDSGKREDFNTGSVRDTQDGKPRYDLIPEEPLYRLAMVYSRGCKKYGERNWEKGQPISRFTASMERHLHAWKRGEIDEDHLSQMVWNAFGIIHMLWGIENGIYSKELDDRVGYVKNSTPVHSAQPIVALAMPHYSGLGDIVYTATKAKGEINGKQEEEPTISAVEGFDIGFTSTNKKETN